MREDLKVIVKKNEIFGEVRFTRIEEKEYAVANDVAKALGYKSPKDAVTNHCKGAIKQRYLTTGGEQEVKLIPEGDIYRLIVKSKLPQAEKFEAWVFDEVLPSIRKHGAYMTDDAIEKALTSPDFIIQLATQLKEERQKRVEAERFQNLLATSNNSVLVREVAKMCCKNGIIIGEKRLWQKLREWKMIFQNSTEPMQRWIESGHFEVMTRIIERSNGAQSVRTARVTGKGQQYIITKLLKEQSINECAASREG